MNCDQAFESLTDPVRNGDAELQDHLDHCPRCRDMAVILEPALGFVNNSGEGTWAPSPWEFAVPSSEQTSPPFLSDQAVRVAEDAATRLLANHHRERRAQRNRWLALTILAPIVAMALYLTKPEPHRARAGVDYSPSGPALGVCTRSSIAAAAAEVDDAPNREASAYEVVMACNACHLLDRPIRRDDGNHLRLQPVKMPDTGGLWPASEEESQVSANISLRWQMASLGLSISAC